MKTHWNSTYEGRKEKNRIGDIERRKNQKEGGRKKKQKGNIQTRK